MKNADNVCDVKLSSYCLYYRGFLRWALFFYVSKAILWAYFDKLEGENQSAMHKIRINISQTIEVL